MVFFWNGKLKGFMSVEPTLFGSDGQYMDMSNMKKYFDTVLSGYRTETDLPDEQLNKLTLFIDMVLIENIVDEFECCRRNGEDIDYEDIEDAAENLIHNIPWSVFLNNKT